MSDDIKDANLELLVGLRDHLDQAERLRGLLDRLLTLAQDSGRPDAAHPGDLCDRPRKAVAHG